MLKYNKPRMFQTMYAVYLFTLNDKMIEPLFDLDDLRSREDVRELREIVIRRVLENNDRNKAFD